MSHITKNNCIYLAVLLVFGTLRLTGQVSGYAKSEGVNIHYKIFGKGEPLLIINGGPGFSSEGFVPLARELAGFGYQAILFDQRGTGRSVMENPDSTNITMDLMVKDMEALRQQLNIEEWSILGHSFGGIMANYYTAQHPKRVKAIVASSSGGVDLGLLEYIDVRSRLNESEQDSLSYWTNRIREGDTTFYARLQRAKYLAPAYVYNRKHIPVVAQRLTEGNMALNALVWADLQRINYDCSDELRGFNKPVLIIQGANEILDVKTAKRADNVFSDSRMVILDSCGHYGWLDQPEKYFGEIKQFLEEVHAMEPTGESDRNMIVENFRKQTECWNRGDIECYCQAYVKSDSTRVISKQGVLYGYEKILGLYQQYWKPENMGQLSFSDLAMERLSNQYYFVTGHFLVQMDEDKTHSGYFSVLMKKVKGKWLIYSDHSS